MSKITRNQEELLSLKQLWINRLVVCGFASLGGGFVLAIYLGAFARTEVSELALWVTAFAAVASVVVAVVAVAYVARTLQATRDTLSATQEMAKEQSRIGDSQIRPYIVFDSLTSATNKSGIGEVRITFKNVGITPASSVRFESVILMTYLIEANDGYLHNHTIEHENKLTESSCATLSQNTTHTTYEGEIHLDDIDDAYSFDLVVTCKYGNYDRTKYWEESHTFSMLNKDGELVTYYK